MVVTLDSFSRCGASFVFESIFYQKRNCDFKETYQNDDIIAKIEIENTDFSSVVLQAEDNEFYLDHDLSGKPDGMGSTFLDYRNVLTDQKLLIYGHNSSWVFKF